MPVNNADIRPAARFINVWAPVLFFMAVIFYASSLPASRIPRLFLFQDISYHAAIYAVLGFFFSRALKNTFKSLPRKKRVVFAVIFGIIYGISDELHQYFVPGRSVSATDLSVDAIAAFIGGLLYR